MAEADIGQRGPEHRQRSVARSLEELGVCGSSEHRGRHGHNMVGHWHALAQMA